ncbi:MAG: glycosyltransferase [Burkholderiales bacterium]|nr:glycosyltransferase [Anaerolineae bacterium]
MRVTHIIKVVRIAGAERHLLTLLPALRERGVDASILLLVEPAIPMDDLAQAAAERDIPLQRMTIYHDADVTLLPRLVSKLRTLKPDVVHTHLLHADLFGIPAAKLAGVRAIVTGRHNDNAFRRRFPLRQINQALWRMADAGIVISSALARFCIEIEGAPPDKLHTVYYGLDTQTIIDPVEARANLRHELGLSDDTLLIGAVCRLIEQKGLIYGLQAFAQISERFPQAHVVIAGDGPLRANLETEASALGLAKRVHFLGWRPDTTPVFAALDVFLAPSLWEGFGLVLLEAMEQSLPIVGSAVSAIPEIVVDGQTGRLVAVRDVDALAAALAELLSDDNLRRQMGAAGYARLKQHFSVARMTDKTLAIYELLAPR